jgi:hypothetical protein
MINKLKKFFSSYAAKSTTEAFPWYQDSCPRPLTPPLPTKFPWPDIIATRYTPQKNKKIKMITLYRHIQHFKVENHLASQIIGCCDPSLLNDLPPSVISTESCNRKLGNFPGLGIRRGPDGCAGEGSFFASERILNLSPEELVLNIHDSSLSYPTPPVVKAWTNALRQGMVADMREYPR